MKKSIILAAALALAATTYAQQAAQPVEVSTAAASASIKPAAKTAKKVKTAKKTGAKKTAKADAAIAKAEDYKVPESEYGTKTVCPVTGDAVTVDSTTTAVKYKGKVYYFCCPACIEQFKANPQKYAK
jgi:YHS domain-containing protein